MSTGWSIEYILDHDVDWIRVMYKHISLSKLEQMKQGEMIHRIENTMDIYNLGYETKKVKKKDELTPAQMSRMAGVKYEVKGKSNG